MIPTAPISIPPICDTVELSTGWNSISCPAKFLAKIIPCLTAVVPNGERVISPVTAFVTSTQSPAA